MQILTNIKKNSIKKKMLLSFYGNTTAVLIIAFVFFFYYSVYHEYTNFTQQKLLTLAQLTASLINSADFNNLVSLSDEKSEEYRKIKDILVQVKKASPNVKYVYTMRKTAKKDIWEFVVDAEDEISPNFSHLGDKYDVSKFEQMKEAYNRPTVDQEPTTDQWGTFLSGYAPIRDNTGRTVGIVGLDIGIETIFGHDNYFLVGLAGMIALAFALTTYSFSRRIKSFLEPVNEITQGAKQVISGNLEYRLNVNTDDELGVMANMINQAADELLSYHKLLEQDLQSAKEQRQKIFKVYSDVIYSVTQGKFNLVSYKEFVLIENEGVLKCETKLETAEDVEKVRSVVKQNLTPLGFSEDRIDKILLCISEAATNVVKHAKDGSVQVRELNASVRLVVLDHGPGMDFEKLPNMIFLKGFSTKISLGVGFSLIYMFADKIYLSTSKNGTFLAMDFYLHESKVN